MGQRAFTRAESLQALTSGRPLDQLLADQSSPAWWLSIRQPTETETKALGAALSVHPLTTEDILAGETREKLDIFDNVSDRKGICERQLILPPTVLVHLLPRL